METKEALIEAIQSINQDITALAAEHGGLYLLDPSTEGYRLITVRIGLKLKLYRLAGENWRECRDSVLTESNQSIES